LNAVIRSEVTCIKDVSCATTRRSCGLDDCGSIPGSGNDGISSRHRVQTGSGPNMGSGALPPAIKRPGMKLTTHLHVVPRLQMHDVVPPLLHTSSWRGP
jgi:hypothetical protein